MKTRLTVIVFLLAALAAVVVFDLRTRRELDAADADRDGLVRQLDTLRHEEQNRAQQIVATQAHRDALRKLAVAHPAAAPAKTDVAATADGSNRQALAIAGNDELRTLRIRAFVGEQRLKFAAILHQLRLTPEQLQRFDAIESEYQQAALDLVSTAKAQGITNPKDLAPLRRDLAAKHDGELEALFGDNYGDWQNAWRAQGARATVDDLLQQTFQTGGAVSPAQSEALVAVVKMHMQPHTSTGYDWNAIATDAATVLTGPQLDAFRTALNVRTLTEKINVAASGRR